SSTTSRCSITDDAATLLLDTSVLSSLKGGGLRQAEDPVNPLQPSPILSTKPGQLQPLFRGGHRPQGTDMVSGHRLQWGHLSLEVVITLTGWECTSRLGSFNGATS